MDRTNFNVVMLYYNCAKFRHSVESLDIVSHTCVGLYDDLI